MPDKRLFNSFLREYSRPIIDKMDKIKNLDIDFFTREKKQKFLRRIYFDHSQK